MLTSVVGLQRVQHSATIKKKKKKDTYQSPLCQPLFCHFSHFRNLHRVWSTASNYNNDMQVHVTQSKEMLVGVLVFSGNSWKTNKSTLEVIIVTFLSRLLDYPHF